MQLTDRDYLAPYIIAEIGVNHEGSIARAKSMIRDASASGAHAVKFQTYKADKLASKSNSPAYWDTNAEPTTSQHELFQKYDLFDEKDYRSLAEYCREQRVDFMSTPFDLDSVDYIAELSSAMKIASADITNIPLLRSVARTGRPVIMSCGASTESEIKQALAHLEKAGAPEVILLHCVLRYPTDPSDANIRVIERLRSLVGSRLLVGYSDHVPPSGDGSMPALELATALGATVLEKHFTDDPRGQGNDHYHAMTGPALKSFVERIAFLRELGGSGEIDTSRQSAAIANARRKVFFARNLEIGDQINSDDIIPLRANVGLDVIEWDSIIGRRVAQAVRADDPVTDDVLI